MAKDDEPRKAELTRELLAGWNEALGRLHHRIAPPSTPLEPYGEAFERSELPVIPRRETYPRVYRRGCARPNLGHAEPARARKSAEGRSR